MRFPQVLRRPAHRSSRRAVLRAGALGWLGFGLADVLAAVPRRSGRSVRGVILAFCPGAPSHLETLDPKPDAPAEIRGSFGTIATALPGVRFGEYLPELARRLDRLTLVRSMTTTSPVHEVAVHRLFAGVTETPANVAA